MSQLLAILRDGTLLVATFGYGGIFLAMMIEGSGIPLPFPGSVLLAFVGYTVWNGQLGLFEAGIAAALGSTIGAWVQYRIARDAGPQLLARYGHRLAITPEKLASADSWFKTHAGRATFFARMTPGVRVYISMAAGLARMRQVTFVVSTFAGTWLWMILFIGLGWAFGRSWDKMTDVLSAVQTTILLAGLVLLVGLVVIYKRGSERV